MSRKIITSLSKFKNVGVLGKRQGGGSMNKRQAQSVEHSAMRLLKRQPFQLGGIVGQHARRGFENCFDKGFENESFYCVKCGTMAKPSDSFCRVCNNNFLADSPLSIEFQKVTNEAYNAQLSTNKFGLRCKNVDCNLPFYILSKTNTTQVLKYSQRRGKLSKEYLTKVNDKGVILNQSAKDELESRRELEDEGFTVCKCFVELKKEYVKKLRLARDTERLAKEFSKNKNVNVIKNAELYEFQNLKIRVAKITGEAKREAMRRMIYLSKKLDQPFK